MEWHNLRLVCRLYHTATNKAVPKTSWVAAQRVDTLWIYYDIMVQLCLLSQSFILCLKMSTIIFPLPFPSISVVRMDYLDKTNLGHPGSTETEPQPFLGEVKEDTEWLQHLSSTKAL